MLIDAGLPIMVAPSDIDESVIKQRVRSEGGSASQAAAELAEAKAATVSHAHPGQITVGADQILVLEDEQGGKSGSTSLKTGVRRTRPCKHSAARPTG